MKIPCYFLFFISLIILVSCRAEIRDGDGVIKKDSIILLSII